MGQKISLDTPIFIYYFEDYQEYSDRAKIWFDGIENGEFLGGFSIIGLIELLTGPKKQGRFDLAKQYRRLITAYPNLSILGINEQTVELASDLGAKYGLKTPDAIHLAAAIDFGAVKFITNDRTLKKIKEIAVEVL